MNGLSGASWVLHELGMVERAQESLALAGCHRLLFEKMSISVGAAGHGMTQLYFWQCTQDPKYLEAARHMADVICDQAVDRTDGCAWDATPEGEVDVGLMGGATGIALFLLYAHCATKESRYLEAGERGLAHDWAQGRPILGARGFPRSTGSLSILYPYLAYGSAGMGTVALRYYLVTGKPLYRGWVQEVKTAVAQKYTITPDLFTGLSGLGHYLLDVHQLLGDESYLDLARETARGLRLFEIPRPEGVAFPYALATYVNCDYASGAAGIATFLHRLLRGGPNTNFMLDELLPR